MSCNCNNIYPFQDMERWSVCQSLDILTNYYTKSEVDEKINTISGDGITSGEVQTMIDDNLINYYTKDVLDRKFVEAKVIGHGNIEVYGSGLGDSANLFSKAPIRGTNIGGLLDDYPNGLDVPIDYHNYLVTIGKYNDKDEYYEKDGENVLSYFQIGDGDAREPHNIFTIFKNGYIKTMGTDGNDVVLQDWMKESETKLNESKSFIDGMNAFALYSNRGNEIQIPLTLYPPFLPSQPTYLKVTGTLDNSSSGFSVTSLTITPQAHNGTATEEGYGWSYPYTGTSNVILSGFTVDGYIPTGGLKTINGQTLEGSGNIEISGGTADLSNYYEKTEVNSLLADKLDASAYTPTDLSQYWTSGETQEAINAATSGIPSSQTIEGLRNDLNALSGDVSNLYDTKLDASAYTPTDLSNYWTSAQTQSAITQAVSGKADASNVYNKTEVNNLISNKANVWCGDEASFNALTNKDANTIYLVY